MINVPWSYCSKDQFQSLHQKDKLFKICSFFWNQTDVKTPWLLCVLQWKECSLCPTEHGGMIETIGFTDCNWEQLSAYLTLALETLLFSKVSKWPWGLETNWKIHAEVLGSMQVSVQQLRMAAIPHYQLHKSMGQRIRWCGRSLKKL